MLARVCTFEHVCLCACVRVSVCACMHMCICVSGVMAADLVTNPDSPARQVLRHSDPALDAGLVLYLCCSVLQRVLQFVLKCVLQCVLQFEFDPALDARLVLYLCCSVCCSVR